MKDSDFLEVKISPKVGFWVGGIQNGYWICPSKSEVLIITIICFVGTDYNQCYMQGVKQEHIWKLNSLVNLLVN